MDRKIKRVCPALALLIIFLLVTAGCASVPGPGSNPAPVPTKTPVPHTVTTTSPQSVVKTLKTGAPVANPTTPPASIPPTLPSATTPLPADTYSTKTCAEQGGFVAGPGERCPGVWQDAVETFSCCSVKPVPDTVENLSVFARPLDLRVDIADYPGSITP
ncbi:MAG: hypothetical protein WC586_09245 [Methanoregula sp.]